MAIYHEPPLALGETSTPEIDWMHPVARAISLKRVWLGAFPWHRWDRDLESPETIAVPATSKIRNLAAMQSVALGGASGDSLALDVGGPSISREIVGFVGSVSATSAVYLVCGKTVFSSNGTHLEIVSGNLRYSRGSTLSQVKSMAGIGAYTPFHATGIWDKSVNGGRVDVMLNGSAATGGSSNATSTAHQQTLSVGRYGSLYSAIQNVIMFYQCSSFPSYAGLEEFHRNPWQVFILPRRRVFSLAALGGGGDLSSSGAAQAGGSATLAADVALAAVGVAVAGGNASPAADVPLSATGIAIAGGASALFANVSLSASGLAQAAGASGLSAEVLLAGAAAALASGNAQLAAEVALLAQGAALAAGNSQIAAEAALLAQGAAQAGGASSLSGGAVGELSASGGATASGSSALSITVQLASAGAASASGAATVSAVVTLTAAGFVQAMGAGSLTVQVDLATFAAAQASGSATLSDAGAVVLMRTPGFVVTAGNRSFRAVAPKRSFRVSL